MHKSLEHYKFCLKKSITITKKTTWLLMTLGMEAKWLLLSFSYKKAETICCLYA
jgi:hypothetical protein